MAAGLTVRVTPVSAPATGIFCPACGRAFLKLRPGPGGRPDASCPFCESLERQRLLSLLLRSAAPALSGARVLDVAPSDYTTRIFREMDLGQLIGLDFDPAADLRAVDVQASITDLPLPDDVVDFAICYHVFEHVPEDRRGMAELARVLRPDGVALVQVPWRPGVDTDEETEPLSPAERLRRFGQADHVRFYGRNDVDDRLAAAGLEVYRFRVDELVGANAQARLGLKPEECTWVVRPVSDAPRQPLSELVAGWVHTVLGPAGDELPDLLPELVAVTTEFADARKAAALAQRRAEDLDARLVAERAAVARRDAELGRLRIELGTVRARSERQQAAIARLRDDTTRLRGQLSALRAASVRGRVGQLLRVAEKRVPEPVRRTARQNPAVTALRRKLR